MRAVEEIDEGLCLLALGLGGTGMVVVVVIVVIAVGVDGVRVFHATLFACYLWRLGVEARWSLGSGR